MKLSEMREILAKRDIQLTKSLGQNFLHDANQLQKIVAAAELSKADKVLEIGPGLGPLTELLLEKAGEVLAIEMDRRLVEVLRERFGLTTKSDELPALTDRSAPVPGRSDVRDSKEFTNTNAGLAKAVAAPEDGRAPPQNLFLLHDDALAFIKREPRDWSDWKLVANLPYSVASPILVELAKSPRRPERMVTTLQLEVAQRLMAQADDDDYGVLTLLVQLDYEPRDSFKIPADCFFPAPNVDSMCVVLQRRARPLLADGQRAAFVKIVKRAFSQRRKMMLKLLKQDWPADKLVAAFAELKISPQERAEKLSLEQFVALTEKLFSHG